MDKKSAKPVRALDEIVACRVCLATTGKLFWFEFSDLKRVYFDITGIRVNPGDGLPQYICYICCGLLWKATKFRIKCLSTQSLLSRLTLSDLMKKIKLLHVQPLQRIQIVQFSVGEQLENNLISTDEEMQHDINDKELKNNLNINSVELKHDPDYKELENNKNGNDEELQYDLEDQELENNINLNNEELQHNQVDKELENSINLNNEELRHDLGDKELVNKMNLNNDELQHNLGHKELENNINVNNEEMNHDIDDKELENTININDKELQDDIRDKELEIDDELTTENNFNNNEENHHDLTPAIDQHQNDVTKTLKANYEKNINGCKVKIICDADLADKKVTEFILNDPNANPYKKMFFKHIEKKYIKGTLGDKPMKDEEKPRKRLKRPYYTDKKIRYHSGDPKVNKFYDYLKDTYGVVVVRKKRHLEIYLEKQAMEFTKKYNFDIVIFSKEEQIRNLLERKESERYKNSIYKCEDCYTGYSYEETYNTHRERHDAALSGNYECNVCKYKFRSSNSLCRHTYLSHKCRYTCKTCGKYFITKSYCRDHYLSHNGGVTYQCQYCPAAFNIYKNQLDHTRRLHCSVRCDICYAVVTPKGLLNHKILQHRKTFTCHLCEKVFNDASALEKHIFTSPNGVCAKNDWPCCMCGDNYSTESILKEHIESFHGRGPRLPKKLLQKRRRNGVTAERSKQKEKSLGYPVMCELCARIFNCMAKLRSHMLVHTGERPFQCASCPKSFRLKVNLQTHTRTHTGERPHKCSLCPKAFTNLGNLQRHQSVHTGLRPYTCHICNKKFRYSSSMNLHVRSVHMNIPLPPRIRRKKRTDESKESERRVADNEVEENETVDGNKEVELEENETVDCNNDIEVEENKSVHGNEEVELEEKETVDGNEYVVLEENADVEIEEIMIVDGNEHVELDGNEAVHGNEEVGLEKNKAVDGNEEVELEENAHVGIEDIMIVDGNEEADSEEMRINDFIERGGDSEGGTEGWFW